MTDPIPSPRSPQPDPLLVAWRRTKDFLRERLETSGRSDVNINAVLREMNSAFDDSSTPIPSPDTDLRTVVEHSSPYRNCQYATAQRAPCPDVNPRVPASWCAFCRAHERLAAALASSESTHGPWCVQDGHGDSAAPFVHGPSCRRSSESTETLDAAPERPIGAMNDLMADVLRRCLGIGPENNTRQDFGDLGGDRADRRPTEMAAELIRALSDEGLELRAIPAAARLTDSREQTAAPVEGMREE